MGSVVNLSDLDNVNPKPVTVAIVGLSMVGKTTLRDRVIHAPSQSLRTQAISAQIVRLPYPEDVVVALLDGGGEKLGQQFDLAESCDHLCVLVDHNASSDLIDIDGERLKQHSAFMSQLRMRIDDRCGTKKSIRLIINKRDLWSQANDEGQARLMEFRDQEIGKWREGRRGESVESLMHSNEANADVSGFVLHLKNSATEGSHAR
ncbi:GTPase domain-containing protein [Stenotrophomonas maltophilia]|uniref:GTPase domain-containing protein n=1 Tax=Stenotrophomonas maltophilia TaxID=40324 RepID=UPI002E7A1BB5|nr:GTPase domain-containing protein [Stenotrophomonas maltophilia]